MFAGLHDHILSDVRASAFAAPPPPTDLEALKAAPEGAGQRMWDVTKEGVTKIPQGFVNSLNPEHILPNVGIGVLIGAGTKLLLPKGGPVAKVAGGLLAGYFLGKPMYDSYSMAWNAKTMADMHNASSMWGDTIGGLPVGMIEGGIGAKLGSGLAGRAMGLRAAAPYVAWKDAQYAKLDLRIDNAVIGANNLAYERLGFGGPMMRAGTRTGFVPPYLLEDLARQNPTNKDYLMTIKQTERMTFDGQMRAKTAAQVDHAGAREVFDAKGQETVGTKVRSEGEAKTGVKDVDTVYEYTGDVRDYYRDVHNRNSIDGKGMKMQSTVHYGENFENAFWDGTRMTYGKPGPASPFETFILRDVTGHEITHGVTEFDARVVYRGQPGALNESFSDVFGALVDQRARGQTAAEANWIVGEGIWKQNVNGRGLRDMLNPGKAYDDPAIGRDPQPAHMKDYNPTRGDNGGVHINSGIPNKAFALFAKDVGGFAFEKPGEIWYKARSLAGSQPSFAQFAYQTIEAARQLGYTAEIPKLEKAWADVGVKPSLKDTGLMDGVPVVLPGTDQKPLSTIPIMR